MKTSSLLKLILSVMILASTSMVYAKRQMDLDDVNINGELHNDNRLRLLARERQQLKNYVKYRTNYRKEIVEQLDRDVAGSPSK